jgi:hypothetical protein
MAADAGWQEGEHPRGGNAENKGQFSSAGGLQGGGEPDILIGRSLGAKEQNYEVFDPASGRFFKFVEGTKIQNVEVFAGHKGAKPLEELTVDRLVEKFGGEPLRWQHAKGFGVLDRDGEEEKAEVHWFQEPSAGKKDFFVKRWRDE